MRDEENPSVGKRLSSYFPKLTTEDFCRLLSGGIAGSAAVGVGHPIDSIKVRVQLSQGKASLSTVVKDMWLREGPHSFMRGALPPVLMRFVVTGLFFSVNGFFKDRYIEHLRSKNSIPEDEEVVLSLRAIASIGALSGICLAPIITPAELVKIQLQNDKLSTIRNSVSKFNGPWDCFMVAVRRRAISRGTLITIFRLAPGWGFYMLTYDGINRMWDNTATLGHNEVEGSLMVTVRVLVSGGIAGAVAWALSYPQDYIKTKIQSHPLERPSYSNTYSLPVNRLGIRDVVKQTMRVRGVRGFFLGLFPCLVRSIPVNMTNFYVYEVCLARTRKIFIPEEMQ